MNKKNEMGVRTAWLLCAVTAASVFVLPPLMKEILPAEATTYKPQAARIDRVALVYKGMDEHGQPLSRFQVPNDEIQAYIASNASLLDEISYYGEKGDILGVRFDKFKKAVEIDLSSLVRDSYLYLKKNAGVSSESSDIDVDSQVEAILNDPNELRMFIDQIAMATLQPGSTYQETEEQDKAWDALYERAQMLLPLLQETVNENITNVERRILEGTMPFIAQP